MESINSLRALHRGAVFILLITFSGVPARPILPLCISVSSSLVACDPGKIPVPISRVSSPGEAYRGWKLLWKAVLPL